MDGSIAIVVFAGSVALLMAAGAAWGVVRSRGGGNTKGDVVLQPDAEGVVIVPVTGTYTTGGFGAFTRNSLGGALAIAPDGVRFKVLAKGVWSFADIERVDARKTLFGARLVFVSREGGRTLGADVGDLAIARQALQALPSGVVLTAQAAVMRDGGSP